MPKFIIDTVESLENKPGCQLVSYQVEAFDVDDAMDKFSKGLSTVIFTGKETDVIAIGLEKVEE